MFFAFSSPPLAAQVFDDDARLWLYIKLDKDISNKLNARLLFQNRFNNNASEYSQVYGDIGLTYKLNKHFRILTDYVFGGKRQAGGTYNRVHQAYTGIVFRQKIKKMQFIYRLLVQAQVSNIYSGQEGFAPRFYERSKFTIKYELNKHLTFNIAQELNSPFYRFTDVYLSRSRSFIGGEYNLSKKSSIEAYFLFQRQLKYKGQPARDFIYGITYSRSL